MPAMLRRCVATRASGAMVRFCGTSLRVPKAPPGSGDVFHAQMMLPKYSLTNEKWFFLFFMCNLGAYSGHYFYLHFLMPANPPNPPRDPDQVRPEKHMHAVDDD
ncbi:unnamed protein product [Cladocopium goreaui]|uniref:Transmembrane protein n=1 Tax=Cladocopium goreaui TaxID=2562237 RepID=A0A9P1GJ77_9DINO|nr:unnamed protein product [Cladocopium goreaui]